MTMDIHNKEIIKKTDQGSVSGAEKEQLVYDLTCVEDIS